MKSRTFISALSHLLGIEEKSLIVTDRNLKEAKIVTSTGARGVNAPDMQPKDLAAFLTAMLATDKPARAVEMFRYFAGMQLHREGDHEAVESLLPDPDHTLFDFLTVACDPQIKFQPDNEFTITFVGTLYAAVESEHWNIQYHCRSTWANAIQKHKAADGDSLALVQSGFMNGPLVVRGITTSRDISSTHIQWIKDIVFQDAA